MLRMSHDMLKPDRLLFVAVSISAYNRSHYTDIFSTSYPYPA